MMTRTPIWPVETDGQRRWYWAASFAVVAAIHATAFLLAQHLPSLPPEEPPPVVIVELTAAPPEAVPAPPRLAPLPPPEVEPMLPEAVTPDPLPPGPIEPPKPQLPQPPRPPQKKPPVVKPPTSVAPHGQPMTAAPTETPPVPVGIPSVAPPDTGASARQVSASYEARLIAQLRRYKQYPDRARRAGQQGIAMLRFTVDRTGRVLTHALVGTSGHQLLDDEALALIQRAAPLPAMPPEMTQQTAEFTVPIDFNIH